MDKTKRVKRPVSAPAPSIGPAQIKPPQPTPIDQMKPEDFAYKIVKVDLTPAQIEAIMGKNFPTTITDKMMLRLNDIKINHAFGIPKIEAWGTFVPKKDEAVPIKTDPPAPQA